MSRVQSSYLRTADCSIRYENYYAGDSCKPQRIRSPDILFTSDIFHAGSNQILLNISMVLIINHEFAGSYKAAQLADASIS